MDLCEGCLNDLPFNRHACQCCGIPLPGPGLLLCGPCAKKPPAADRTLALFRYDEPVRTLVHEMKFRNRFACIRLFGQLLAQAIPQDQAVPEALIPVPLHRRRYVERGYNQSAEIARQLSTHLSIPLVLGHCARVRDTTPQSDLPAEERRRNLRNAFIVRGLRRFRHVAVVDDVVTTATTVNEMAKTLKRAGVERVDVYAIARA